ncbi:MAG TPA: hypothetical protein DCG53_11870, partial [Syntrophus sp. (in: bacteria)]|nr:hypothetical protein [Syntrophus sp. (in: bacteria)]
VDEAAQYLGISRSEFVRIVADKCPCKGFGRRRRFKVPDLDEFNPKRKEESS